jgi:hypothetical protein
MVLSATYGIARASDAATIKRLQNMRRHICVNAVLPRFASRLFLILVASVGWGRFAYLSFEFHFLHF